MDWEKSDIVKRLCRALDIANTAISLFSERGYTDGEIIDNSFRPDKPIAEVAMLLYAASGVKHYSDVAERISDLGRCLGPLARSKRVMLSMSLHPSVCVELAVPHILLSKLGFRQEQFDNFFRSCVNSQASRGHERPPFASLEKSWILAMWRGVKPGPDWQIDLKRSVLNWPIDILGGLKEDAYALTHLVIYCTDFGFHVNYRLPRPKGVVLAEARSLLAKCLDEEDYDLAAETLMIWPQLGSRWCASSAFAFRVLATVEDQVGVLPSVRTKTERLKRLEGDDKTRYAYATAYHTALVMGLLCAVSLRKRIPLTKLTGLTFEKRVIDQLWAFIDADQGHWQPIFAALPESERSTLAPLLLDIALAQKFRKRDYDSANQLLKIAAKCEMVQSPLLVQASEMLDRLAAFYEAVEAPARLQTG